MSSPESLEAFITNSIGMKLRLVRPGTFVMGSKYYSASDEQRPVHLVTLTRPYYLGVHTVTQSQWERVMGSNPSQFKGPDRPVESVSWHEAQEFCKKLSRTEDVQYRLPTEAEWEYACRAGSTTEYCYGNEPDRYEHEGDDPTYLSEYAWFDSNSWYREPHRQETHDVGQKKPNAWGLHDMHGNVWEWCQDWYGVYPGLPRGFVPPGSEGERWLRSQYGPLQSDPTGPSSGKTRVLRGGSWHSEDSHCTSATRHRDAPDVRYEEYGFRVALPLP